MILTLNGFNSASMYFPLFRSFGSEEGSNGFQIIVLSEKKRPCRSVVDGGGVRVRWAASPQIFAKVNLLPIDYDSDKKK